MLFTGDSMYNQAVLESEVPESIQKLRIDNLYKWFRTGGRIKAFWTNVKMKIQLKQVEKEEKTEIQGEEEV
jgi:hypothetical protein